jgi:TRAP-type C4-dicarboxylate transport system permease small subunit
MQFFGLLGTLFFLAGFIAIGYLIVAKLSSAEFALTNRPAFYIALTTMIIGMQLFLSGFVAEMIVRNAPERNHYQIDEKSGW